MDLNELRRKRIKLFDSQSASHGDGKASSSSTATNLDMAAKFTYPATFPQRSPDPRHHAGYPPNIPPPPNTGPPANMGPLTSTPSIADDEKYARELQAEIERHERHEQAEYQAGNKDFVLPAHIAEALQADRKRTDELQQQGHSNEYSYKNDVSYGAPWIGDMTAEDEKLAREIQRQINNEEYDDDDALSPPRTRSPRSALQLPPKLHAPTRIMAHDIDESTDAIAVREFATTIVALDCGICGCRITLDQEKLTTLFKSAVTEPGREQVEFLVKCSACAGKTCPGCSTAVTAPGMSYGSTSLRNAFHATWHCDRGRLALIWFLLCGYDHVVLHNKPKTASNPKPKTSTPDDELTGRRRSKGKQRGPSGIGYSLDGEDPEYDSFGDDEYHSDMEDCILSELPKFPTKPWNIDPSMPKQTPSMKRPKRRAGVPKPAPVDVDDNITTHVLCILSATLPSTTDQLPPTKFDFEPPHFLASMLRRSSILDIAAELLRNDSIDNASQRFSLYQSVIVFMTTLNGGGRLMTSILHESRQINKAGHDLLKVSCSQPTRVAGESADTAQSLTTSMTNLARQTERLLNAMQGSTGGREYEMTEEEQHTILMCTMISDCAAAILKESAKLPAAAAATETQQNNNGKWQRELAILLVTDDTIIQHHYHAKEIQALLEVTNPPRNRLRHIFKEIVTLETSLPPGIFVRYGEGRVDVMKIVIIGPQGTPYENGMFEFDMFLPLDYPNVPPMVQLKTTGGGTVGFNPNLYADGKVCLSLLGTWQGESWQPGKSTLLQVLVSIQAMIFNDEPWCNEPGRDSDRGSERSNAHNRYLYPHVVKFGMIEWLENKRSRAPAVNQGGRRLGEAQGSPTSARKEEEEDIWIEVTKKHFEAAGEDIVKTVCNWVNDKPPPPRTKARKGKGKQMPFPGPGRTIADAETLPGPSPPPPFDPAKLKQSGNLASMLKEILAELQGNFRAYAAFGDFPEDWE